MRSRANFKSHPIHPMLIPFPLAFLVGSFLFDAAAFLTHKEELWSVGYWLQISGVGFGILAAIPGIIDFIFTVPPKSSGKKRALTHGLLNSGNLLIFTGVWFYRQGAEASPYIILAVEVMGVILLSIAGWMGGTLAYRNQIGVDHRYANAGKWKEEYFERRGKTIEVGKAGELKPNQMKLLHVGDKRIVLARTEKDYVAFDDSCTHRGGSLAGGNMICGMVQCPWHGSQFDVSTGEVQAGPAKKKINIYPVMETDGKIFLNL
jgi:uncharacterized membrane protein/nitrite reductase/ring-hydroxylating ferredoxin subunit